MDTSRKKSTILLTGSKGFLGKVLFKKLVENKDYKIKCVDLPEYNLTKLDDCLKVTKGSDIVINLAGLVLSRVEQLERPAEVIFNNILVNLQILEAARLNKVRKVILISSITAYPAQSSHPFKEEDLWEGSMVEDSEAYGAAKRVLVLSAKAYKTQYGMDIVCLLFPNLYGPEDKFNYNPPPLIPNTILQIYKAKRDNKKFIIAGNNGQQRLDFLYVEDAVEAILLALKRKNLPELINVGTGRGIKIKDVFKIIAMEISFKGIIKWDKTVRYFPARYLDIFKMKRFLKFEPKYTIESGLQKTVKWFLKTYEKES